MFRVFLFMLFLAFMAGYHTGTAQAASGYAMQEGAETAGPAGYYALCRRDLSACPAAAAPHAPRFAPLHGQSIEILHRINRKVNATIRAVTDQEQYGRADVWGVSTQGHGDCEDYAMEKRRLLLAAGFPASAVLIGVARGTDSPYHAVLIVRTDHGDLVLDNLSNEIREWTKSGYQFVIRQSMRDSRRWVAVAGQVPAPREVIATADARR